MSKYIDAHCHYCGGTNTIFNATCPDDWDTAVAQACKGRWATVGIHPWHINTATGKWRDVMQEKLQNNPNLMVGEIGLDKHRPDIEQQIKIFITQMDMATTLRRGVHIHCVGVWDKMLEILKKRANKLPPFILFHRYSGSDADIARLAEKYNAYFSYNAATNTQRIIQTPIDRLLVESDANLPTDTTQIIDNIAAICNIKPTEMRDILHNNFIKMVQNG